MSKLIKCDVCGQVVEDNSGEFQFDSAIKMGKPIKFNYGTETHDHYSLSVSDVCIVDFSPEATYRDKIDVCEKCVLKILRHINT